ncbi:protein of unknown function [Thiomonas sp. Bio17B3]|nr:protein of unknown function [Thiomonas sp. Bio17B3]VDY07885.1 protein of unknown function [Thiomonas sp. Sup16B3]VDY13196.1 protein of unknown function [Thiomonas sp. OC7]VDY17598.1 protein of unknown function [Thiomonas sp. CB2]
MGQYPAHRLHAGLASNGVHQEPPVRKLSSHFVFERLPQRSATASGETAFLLKRRLDQASDGACFFFNRIAVTLNNRRCNHHKPPRPSFPFFPETRLQ